MENPEAWQKIRPRVRGFVAYVYFYPCRGKEVPQPNGGGTQIVPTPGWETTIIPTWEPRQESDPMGASVAHRVEEKLNARKIIKIIKNVYGMNAELINWERVEPKGIPCAPYGLNYEFRVIK